MGLRNWTPKIFGLYIVGAAITILFMISIARFWRHDFRPATWCLISGAVLAVIFFRNRKFAFAAIVLSFLLVNVGTAALFHPTPARLLVAFGAAACAYFLVVWHAKKYPNLKRKDWKTLVERDP